MKTLKRSLPRSLTLLIFFNPKNYTGQFPLAYSVYGLFTSKWFLFHLDCDTSVFK